MKMIMKCPRCGHEIDFQKQVGELFDYHDGSPEFDEMHGVMFHQIMCEHPECKAHWTMTLSGMQY